MTTLTAIGARSSEASTPEAWVLSRTRERMLAGVLKHNLPRLQSRLDHLLRVVPGSGTHRAAQIKEFAGMGSQPGQCAHRFVLPKCPAADQHPACH